jgi:hypothetical protein
LGNDFLSNPKFSFINSITKQINIMPAFREDVDFFFKEFIKVSNGGGGDASVWAVGSYQGKFILTVIEKK